MLAYVWIRLVQEFTLQLESHFNSVPSPSTQPDVHIRKNVTTLQVDAVGSDLNGVESHSIQVMLWLRTHWDICSKNCSFMEIKDEDMNKDKNYQ